MSLRRVASRKLLTLAAIAQLVEHLIRNEGVGGSNPSCGTTVKRPGPARCLAAISPFPATLETRDDAYAREIVRHGRAGNGCVCRFSGAGPVGKGALFHGELRRARPDATGARQSSGNAGRAGRRFRVRPAAAGQPRGRHQERRGGDVHGRELYRHRAPTGGGRSGRGLPPARPPLNRASEVDAVDLAGVSLDVSRSLTPFPLGGARPCRP
jgi:hypothetical protein